MIKVIAEKRSDAINVYNESLLSALKMRWPNIGHIFLDNKRFRGSFFNFILEIFNTIKIIFLVRADDILLFTDPLSFNTIASLFVRNKKYVVFYHYENDPFYYKFLPFISYRKILSRFNGIICISNFSLSQLGSLGIDTAKCKVVYCGLNHGLFRPSPSRSKRYPFEYILSIGSEEPRKNMENILKTFRILKNDFPQLKLLKAGNANPINRKRTMALVESLQLTEDVVFTDYLQEEDLPQIYSGAKLLLFPSLLEGFGFPIVEAMACGCPVVTSDREPMKELVGPEQQTVDPLSPNDLAKMCKKILSDHAFRDAIIRNGLTRAKEFNWERAATEVHDYMVGEESSKQSPIALNT